MSKINELSQQVIDVDMAAVPEQMGDFAPAPQPGKGYALRLPRMSEDTDWKEQDVDENRTRLVLQFGGKDSGVGPLTIVESPFGEGVGDPVKARITNEERKFNDADESAVSPLHYLLKEAFGRDMSGKSNLDFAKALISISKSGNDVFRANISWQTSCNPNNPRYIYDEAQAKSVVDPEGTLGCGQRWADRQRTNKRTGEVTAEIPRDEETGKFLTQFTCHCGARLQPFVELRNFKAYGEVVAPVAEEPVPAPAPAPVAAPKAVPVAAPKAAATAPAKAAPVAAKPAGGAVSAAPKPTAARPAQAKK